MDQAGTNSCNIYLFDRASGRLQRRISGLPNVIYHLAYSPDGRYLAAALGEPNGIRVYETRDYGEIARDSRLWRSAAIGSSSTAAAVW